MLEKPRFSETGGGHPSTIHFSFVLLGSLIGAAHLAAAEQGRTPEQLIEACRSTDLFVQKRAEGELRRAGARALPALGGSLDDKDLDLALRMRPVFRDVLRTTLDQLDSDALALERETKKRDALLEIRAQLPKLIATLRAELGLPPPPEDDPEKERQAAVDREEKARKLRAAEEALRDAEAQLPEIQPRLPERTKLVEESRARIVKLGAAAFGTIAARRESVLIDLLPFYAALLASIREQLDPRAILGEPPAPAPAAGSPAARDLFERRRYLLSTLWAQEVDRKGPLAGEAAPLLEEHLRRLIADLQKVAGQREAAEEDLYALGRRGREALEAVAPPADRQVERLKSLLLFRVEPRLAERTGIDFRGYPGLPFRERRRIIIHYGRVAGRDAIPTLRRIALDESFEPSLRVRLAAAEVLAGPNIRDWSAIQVFETKPELLKIPEVARDFVIIRGRQLVDEKRYAEAIEEFRKLLEETPYDFRANYEAAFAYLLLKDYAKAILHFEISRRIDPKDTLTLYNLACAYALDGQVSKALEALEASVQAGFEDVEHIEGDPDLKALREDPRFHQLTDRLRQGSKASGKKAAPKGEAR